MIKFYLRSIFILATILAFSFQYVSATHIRGADISYRCLGGNQYQIVLTVYRDCSGVAVPTSTSVEVASNCGTTNVTVTLDPLASDIEVSQLCPTSLSTCQGGSFPGVRMYTYVGTVTIQPNCGTYTFEYSDCCRNTVSNLVDPSPPSLGFCVRAELNSNIVSSANCDFAPAFTSLPVPYFCVNQLVNYSHGALDVDGDSLSYSLTAPLDDQCLPLTFTFPFTAQNPMPTANGFQFDSLTGQMTFTPTQQGVYAVAMLVREYRNGVLIGTTMRDIQIVVINCTNNAPQINNCLSVSNVTGAQVIDCNSLGVCPGQNVSFTITGRDPDGQLLTVTSNIAASIPGATLSTVNVRPDSVVVTFNWIPSANDTGFRYFTVQFRDNACPIAGNQLFTYDITVLDGIYAGPDLYYCTGGGPVQVNVFGGTHFGWSNTNGMVSANPDSSVVFLAPSSNQTYYIQSDLMGGCKTLDTLNVFNVSTFSTSIASPDDTICLNSSTTLTVTATPANQGPFTYNWTSISTGGIQTPAAQTTEVRPRTNTSYLVTVVSNSGCVVRDSFPIIIQGVGPKVTVLPSSDYVCPGTNVSLNTSVSALECGPTADPQNPCLPNSVFALQNLGTGTANASGNTTPYIGFWMDGRVQYLYRASELQALGLGAGTITDIGFNISTKLSTAPYNNFTIKMACTNLTQLPTSFVTAGFTTVLNPQSYTTTVGWNTHTLDLPYNWDGFSNILVEICFDNSAYTQYDNVLYTPTAYTGSVLWDNADLGTQSGCTALTTPTQGQNRPNTRFIMCTAPLTNYTFTWTPSLPDTSAPIVQVNSDITYQVVVDDGTCQGDTTITVHVDSAVLISAGPDLAICGNDTVQLNAQLLHPAVPYCVPTYVVSSTPYLPILPTGGTLAGPVGDDVVSGAIPVPFPFQFFCSSVSQFYISTNGFITFSAAQGSGCCAGQNLPTAGIPNNLIALCWEDLNTSSGGNIDYFVSGTTPNRVGVIRWRNVAYYSVGGFINGEIHVYETSNVIEMHMSAATTPNQANTLGIENATGTVGYSPAGYNAAGWTVSTPIAFRFTPQSAGNALTNVVWTPAAGLSNNTIANPLASPDTTTTYVVDATFTNGCTTHDTVKISIGNFPYSLNVVPDTICNGDSAQLIFTGAGVSYSWTPTGDLSSATIGNPFASPAATTTYHITAFDSIGCRVEDTLVVVVRSRAPITLGSDSATCPTDSLTLIPSGGPYVSYLWSTSEVTPFITTANQILNPQQYYVRVFDGFCFYQSDTVQIAEFTLDPIVVQPAGDTGVCIGDSLVLRADPGYVSYLWSNNSPTQTITVSTAGTYTYMAIDSNGCVLRAADTAFVTIQQRPLATILSNDDTICEGQSTAVLSVNTVSGIVYIWNPGGTISDSFVASTPGRYYLIASNNGCNNIDSIDIASTVPPTIDLGEDQSFCGCDTSISLASSNSVSGTYVWSTTANTSSINVTSTGLYSLTVSDANNCTANDAVDITIRCLTADAVVADPSTGTVFIGRNATLDVASTSYSGSFSYVWTPATYLDDSTKKSPYVNAPQNTTTYTVMVTDLVYGCVAYDSVRLAVVPPGVPPMPNAFSPNGDGVNDTYGPFIPPSMQGIYVIGQMRIYNRWGQMVYNGTTNWDGMFSGALQPANTYVYYITIEGPDQNNPNVNIGYNLTGSFTLLH
jgi:gliding motility-associated-like protein